MRNIISLLLVFFPVFVFCQSYKIINMQGIMDKNGVIHLIYRAGPNFSFNKADIINSDAYSYNTLTQSIDTLFKANIDPVGQRSEIIGPVNFWDNDPDKFIRYFNPYQDFSTGLIQTYFSKDYIDGPGSVYYSGNPIIISAKNPSTVYLSTSDSIFVSADSGRTWNAMYKGLILVAVNPYDKKYLYAVNNQNQLMFSGDAGRSFILADENSIWSVNSQLEFDRDKSHVYAITENNQACYFVVSDNYGKPSTWINQRETEKIYPCWEFWYSDEVCAEFNRHFQIAIDDSVSGKVYISEGRDLNISYEYGTAISLDTTFSSQITGLYLVPGKETLYVTTAYKILKYSNNKIETLKDIAPTDLDQFYPLQKGNIWIYYVQSDDYSDGLTPVGSQYYLKKEIIGDTLMEDGFSYKIIEQTSSDYWRKNYSYFRFYKDSIISNKYICYNLSGIPGDQDYDNLYNCSVFIQEKVILFWDSLTTERTYFIGSLGGGYDKLVKGFGLTYSYNEYDFGYTTYSLTGAIINRVSYGDTSFIKTGIKDHVKQLFKFSLHQNYPNPFNPETVIRYQLAGNGYVSIKIFDISGREIQMLVNERQNAGNHSVTFNGSKLASGLYFYRIDTKNFSKTRKMLLLK